MKLWYSMTKTLKAWFKQKFLPLAAGIVNRENLGLTHSYRPETIKGKKYSHFGYWLLGILIAIVVLTGVSGYRFYDQPQLDVGTISPATIIAPRDGRFIDHLAINQKKEQARAGIIPILKYDQQANQQIETRLDSDLVQIEEIKQITQPFPFIDPSILDLEVQNYLRTIGAEQWRKLLDGTDSNQYESQFSAIEQKTIQQLQAYQSQSPLEWQALIRQIEQSRSRYQQARQELTQQALADLSLFEIDTLLQIDTSTWQQTRQAIDLALDRILTQGISTGVPQKILHRTVQIQLQVLVPDVTESIAIKLLQNKIEPNLVEDREAIKRQAEQAVLAVKPEYAQIEQGQVIVNEGAIITPKQFVLLDGFGLSRRHINWLGLGQTAAIVTLGISLFLLVQKQIHLRLRCRDYLLLFSLAFTAPLLNIWRIPYVSLATSGIQLNLAAIGILVGSFYNRFLAIILVLSSSGLVVLSGNSLGWTKLIAATIGGLVAAWLASQVRSREAVAKLGFAVGLSQGGIYLLIKLILSSNAGAVWYALLPSAFVFGFAGLIWCMVAMGISPYLERLFDVVTPIRLVELSNPNLPLLKRLATEAPGTFQHTMSVACLAEAAARNLGCNVELVRAGTLYHDIGKLHDPLGFIENQMGGPNKHDRLDDPYLSAKIIKKHVSEGLVMARRYGLPQALQAFIPEHQGKILISYFYYQACQRAKASNQPPPQEAEFRYVGPIPQSRETGIVMLADACEAALRSLTEATPQKALGMISKILKARWQDQQLVDSGLKYEELPKIAEIFVQVWQQYNHQRIAYPKEVFDHKTKSHG